MANKKSPAIQAIKDMLELDIDITFFTGNINNIHAMNAEIGIITKEKAERKVKEVKVTVRVKPAPAKPKYDKVPFIINPDGTIAISGDWDFK